LSCMTAKLKNEKRQEKELIEGVLTPLFENGIDREPPEFRIRNVGTVPLIRRASGPPSNVYSEHVAALFAPKKKNP
jgi:hypothetical protein